MWNFIEMKKQLLWERIDSFYKIIKYNITGGCHYKNKNYITYFLFI